MSAVIGGERNRRESNRRSTSPDLQPAKRQKPNLQDHHASEIASSLKYTVGWICALPIELAAAKAMLDHVHESLVISADDSNSYIMGDMGGHNVVMACLPTGQCGNNNAATVANNMHRSFPSIRLRLMVGIGGGVPGRYDIRLGDVVVSDQVVQYDLGKTVRDGKFERTGAPVRPPQRLLTAVSKLEASHASEPSKIPAILDRMIEKHPTMTEYTFRDTLQDQMFDSTYDHVDSMDTCVSCSASRTIKRPPRPTMNPKIHHGVIASGNQVMKHGTTRDRLAQELGAICFEMEAAGLMDHFQCLVIRGICDYSDSHKNKEWQRYAAATAAAYARELLSVVPREWALQTPGQKAARHIRLLESLSFDSIDSRRSTVKYQHFDTCKWLLTHADYLDWSNPAKAREHHGFLWIKGKPGAGKSTIMNFALKQASEDTSQTVVSFFFNARGSALERSVVGLYRALLFQLLGAIPCLVKTFDHPKHQDELDSLWGGSKQRNQRAQWSVDILRSLLRDAVEKLGEGRLTCFIDALDKCAEDEVEEMVEFFEDLGASAVAKSTHLRICLSSRHYPHIDIQHGLKLVLELQEGHGNDIALYIQQKLKVGSNKTSDEIRSKIRQKAGGIFMWVVLVVDILNAEYKKGRIFAVKMRLNTIPTKLSDLFKEILSRDNKDLQDMRLCIQWILFATRPLRIEEYYFAVVSGLSPEGLGEWDREELDKDDMYRFLLSSSKGLAEVTKGTTQRVQFIHESVREFFLKDGLRELWPDLEGDFDSFSHDQLKKSCYTWVKLGIRHLASGTERPHTFSAMEHQLRVMSNKLPFLDYAIRGVFYHANIAASKISQQGFLADFDLRGWINLDNLFESSPAHHHTPNASLVYILAENNHARLIESALCLDPRINIEGERYGYPLFVASANGYQDAVRALLQETHIDSDNSISSQLIYGRDLRTFRGQTPLQWAMEYGRVRLAKHLIFSRESRDSMGSDSGREVLFWAANSGHTEIAKMMLAIRGIDINARDPVGRTPLSLAAEKGHQSIVRLLIEIKGIKLEPIDSEGLTPLLSALSGGHENAVNLLIKTRGVDVNRRSGLGQTPLSRAASYGRYGMAKLLLGAEGTEINSTDHDGTTALISAATFGHYNIVKLLLGTESVQINSRDDRGTTALINAAMFGHYQIVKLLLGIEGIAASLRDNSGMSALDHASVYGRQDIMKLLS
ncbi:hypothetical protein NW762_011433 [Fusarium torreyae]|uniref:Nucleoside phosphorylase domain-containing protein n=1 Tax=Fusarium torreyae TaxID=1237075 RepID=A0A9W8V9B5_9HYPO|nr:hypothetical protein NW762_011433 [Fusarium torreyae]